MRIRGCSAKIGLLVTVTKTIYLEIKVKWLVTTLIAAQKWLPLKWYIWRIRDMVVFIYLHWCFVASRYIGRYSKGLNSRHWSTFIRVNNTLCLHITITRSTAGCWQVTFCCIYFPLKALLKSVLHFHWSQWGSALNCCNEGSDNDWTKHGRELCGMTMVSTVHTYSMSNWCCDCPI